MRSQVRELERSSEFVPALKRLFIAVAMVGIGVANAHI